MTKRYLNILLILSILFLSCKNEAGISDNENSEPIVKVFDQYLYTNDLASIIPVNSSTEDSLTIAQSYINNWIQNQLMIYQAEELLGDQKTDIDKKTNDFRNSLLIHELKKELITMNLDSNISNDNITSYYETHNEEFKLKSPIVKGFLLKFPNSPNNISSFRIILSQSDELDLDDIIIFVNSNNGVFENFINNWTIFTEQILKMPIAVDDENNLLLRNSTFEGKDDNFFYYMYITEKNFVNNIAPLEYVKDDIINILTQIQQTLIIEKYKQEIYEDAIKSGDIEYFK